MHLINGNWNGLESEWARIKMQNGNKNKLFTLTAWIGIGFEFGYIAIDVFTLSWNQNELLQVTKMILVDYFIIYYNNCDNYNSK